MERQKAKKLLKLALVIYVASFLVFNWNDVSWIFNYRVVHAMVNDFFNPYPSIEDSEIKAFFYPNRNASGGQPAKEFETAFTDRKSALEIPAIGLDVPVVFSDSADKNAVTKDLDSGVVYYPGSVLPGKEGQIVILGHSAPPGWPKIKYDWAFNDLDKLNPGDIVFIDLNNRQYAYRVKKSIIIDRGGDIPNDAISPNANTLILITCWPPGKDNKRMVVIAELTDNI